MNTSAATRNRRSLTIAHVWNRKIQGRKHGFLAGNVSYYVGGFHASWKLIEDETIGLTHPFHHDLRSRGVGIVESELAGTEHTGTGNDYMGWEFYKDTRILYGSVTVDGETLQASETEEHAMASGQIDSASINWLVSRSGKRSSLLPTMPQHRSSQHQDQ